MSKGRGKRAPVKATQIKISRIMGSLANWIVNTDKFGAIGERCFHLHLVDHFGDAFHDLIAAQDPSTFGHEFRNRLTVARSFHDEVRYKGDTFGIVELDDPCAPPPSHERRAGNHQLFSFARCKVHTLLPFHSGFNTTTSSALGKGRVQALGSIAEGGLARRAPSQRTPPLQSERS